MSVRDKRMSGAVGFVCAFEAALVATVSLALASCSGFPSLFGTTEATANGIPSVQAPAPQPTAVADVPWPTHGWQTSAPEAQGIDSTVLADAMEKIRAQHIPVHSLLVERHGAIVLDAYFYPFADNEAHDVASVTKSVTSTLVGIAVGERKLADVNTPILSLLPDAAAASVDRRKARITLADLLSMKSGLDCSAEGGRNFLQEMESSPHWTSFAISRPETSEPGSTFDYCAGNMHLVSAALTRSVGTSTAQFAQHELFAPLGIQDAVWPTDADGVSHGFADLKLQPRDMAKLGYLWLHNGVWEGKQIVPASYLAEAFSGHADVQPGIEYGYGMWIYPERGHAGGPADIEANGNGGQRIAVVPSQDMVVVITGKGLDANEVSALIADAPKSDRALAPNAEGDMRLENLVADAAQGDVRLAAAHTPLFAHIPIPKPADRTGLMPTGSYAHIPIPKPAIRTASLSIP